MLESLFDTAIYVAMNGFGSADLPLTADLALTVNRASLGLAFCLSGWNKTVVPSRHAGLVATLRDAARLPFARQLSWLVCLTELTAGAALFLGVGSGLAAVVVFVLCCVATATVETRQLSATFHPINRLDWIDDLFFIPANLFLIQLVVVLFVGTGFGLI